MDTIRKWLNKPKVCYNFIFIFFFCKSFVSPLFHKTALYIVRIVEHNNQHVQLCKLTRITLRQYQQILIAIASACVRNCLYSRYVKEMHTQIMEITQKSPRRIVSRKGSVTRHKCPPTDQFQTDVIK